MLKTSIIFSADKKSPVKLTRTLPEDKKNRPENKCFLSFSSKIGLFTEINTNLNRFFLQIASSN